MNKRQSTQRVVLITGASQGIGLVTAEFLASEGYRVYAGIRASSNLDKLQAIRQRFPKFLKPVVCDVTDELSIQQAVSEIVAEAGTIDILINNACLVYWGTSEVCTLQEQINSMNVNYFGIVRMLQKVLPVMRAKKRGHIINMSSVSGFEAYPGIETYVATKFALQGLSESLAVYLKNWNIQVTLVEPGNVKTEVANHSSVGSRKVEDTPAFNHYAESIYQISKASYPTAQEAIEVAKLIQAICESPQPHFRYQTSESAQKRAAIRFKDPTGDSYLEEKRKLLADRDLKLLLNE